MCYASTLIDLTSSLGELNKSWSVYVALHEKKKKKLFCYYVDLCFLLHMTILLLHLPLVYPDSHPTGHLHASETPC